MTAPERIYLQGAADAPDCEAVDSGVTWCWHRIDDSDVEYVRADIVDKLSAELAALRHDLERYIAIAGEETPEYKGCSCAACRPVTVFAMRMVVCETCGNKRCPHAADHRNVCSGSNEPGQIGSSYAGCAVEPQKKPRDHIAECSRASTAEVVPDPAFGKPYKQVGASTFVTDLSDLTPEELERHRRD